MATCYATLEQCEEFAAGLPESVRPRARKFFQELDRRGRLESTEVAQLLACEPPAIGRNLTKWLRSRAGELGCPFPYGDGRGEERYGGIEHPRPGDDPQRTYYENRDGIAARMVTALW